MSLALFKIASSRDLNYLTPRCKVQEEDESMGHPISSSSGSSAPFINLPCYGAMGEESLLADLYSSFRKPQDLNAEGAGTNLVFHYRDRESKSGNE